MYEQHRRSHRNTRRQRHPAQTWRGKAQLVWRGQIRPRDRFSTLCTTAPNPRRFEGRSRKRQSHDFTAVFAERQVPEHAVALGSRKSLLGKSRQQIGIRMRALANSSV
jgi:hypothetical protein